MINNRVLHKKDYFYILIIELILSMFLLTLACLGYKFGSTIDWNNQHWAIPDYFRMLFYDTHDLFPDFAANLGAGQNIYYLSYYGLFSPIILVSFLFPNVPMVLYIIVVSILSLYVDVALFYYWVKPKLGADNAFLVTFLFIFSTSLIFHSHRHIMFVNYMPFLLLALIGVERFRATKSRVLLIISSLCIILSSYFFSVGALIAIVLYFWYLEIQESDRFITKEMIKKLLSFLIAPIIAIFMAGILLLPTAFVLLNGRDPSAGGSTTAWLPLLFKPILGNIVYNPYSIGTMGFGVIAVIIGLLSRKKHVFMLSVCFSLFFCCPIFIYLLNGTLYLDAKVLIPFLPIFMLIVGNAIDSIFQKKVSRLSLLIASLACACLFGTSCLFGKNMEYYTIIMVSFPLDVAIILAGIALFNRIGKRRTLVIPLISFCLIACISINAKEEYVPMVSEYADYDSTINDYINQTLKDDSSFYRFGSIIKTHDTVNFAYNTEMYRTTIYSSLHNRYLSDFYFDELYNENQYRNAALMTESRNYLYNMYMGQKYLVGVAGKKIPGYSAVATIGSTSLFMTNYAFPVGHASDKIMSEAEFNTLEYPYDIEALMEYTIVDTPYFDSGFSSEITAMTLSSVPELVEQLPVKKLSEDDYVVSSETSIRFNYDLPEPLTQSVVLLRFNVNNVINEGKSPTVKISINGTTNKLTNADGKYFNGNNSFEYVFIAGKTPMKNFRIRVSEGAYQISDIQVYVMPLANIREISNDLDAYNIDRETTQGNIYSGTIDVTKDGYFVMSVPYDEGFDIIIDGQSVPVERVDKDFIGAKIEAGHHTIRIEFHAPLKREGTILSAIGTSMFLVVIGCEIARSLRRERAIKKK